MRGSILFNTYFSLLAQQLEEAYAYSRLQAMTYKDDLTDLYNQRYLPVVLEQELSRASRSSKEFSVLFCDVDYFKTVNDTKGHMVGSRVLVELSKVLKGSIRATDFAFRYGGDEYVIVLSDANSKNAAQVAERLRQRTAGTTFDVGGNEIKITLSIGVATYPEHAKSIDANMQMADEAMYYGKHKSRNVVSVAS
jgi:diguanylate cyclase (GGDEF)-like protein